VLFFGTQKSKKMKDLYKKTRSVKFKNLLITEKTKLKSKKNNIKECFDKIYEKQKS
jgi:hypothetical protein